MINYVDTSDIQTINGLKAFGTLPECNGTPLLDNQLVNKFYVDHLSIHQSVSRILYNLTIYQIKSDIGAYLTLATTTVTYQPSSLMSNYLTVTTANTTYQPKTDMINYLTIS